MYEKKSKSDKIIEIEWNEGSIIGFFTNINESTKLVNKLNGFYDNAFDITMELDDNYGEKVAMIENLYVEPYFRMKGYGSQLLKKFIKKAKEKKVDFIILMADKTEDNLFDLVKWYESYGFKLLQDDDEFSLMTMKLK